jgi:hypothetical protein
MEAGMFNPAVLGSLLLGLAASDELNGSAGANDVPTLIARVRLVGGEAARAAEARAARDALARLGPDCIAALLDGMDTPDTVAANWLRSAFDEVVRRAMKADPASLPVGELRRFVLDANRQGRVRRLALDVLTALDPAAPATLIPPLLDDPEFRRDAVAVALAAGERAVKESDDAAALVAFGRAFDAAREADQVRAAAAKLKSLGRDVSIVEHLGFVVEWSVIGPFNGPEYKTFATVYPPEREIKLDTTYDAPAGKVAWRHHRTSDEFGTVDLVKAVAATDDAAAYAFATVESPSARDAQIRCGADDNIQVWLNGKRVFGKEEWQNGTRLDRFIAPVQLRAGANTILVKVCQGPKYRDPGMANPWSLQLRICDATGRGIRPAPSRRDQTKDDSP